MSYPQLFILSDMVDFCKTGHIHKGGEGGGIPFSITLIAVVGLTTLHRSIYSRHTKEFQSGLGLGITS